MGAEAIAATMEQYFIASPDVVCKISKQRIHLYANDESMIEFDVTTRFTQILTVEGLPEGSQNRVVVRTVVDELGDKLKNVKLSSKIEQGECGSDAVDVPVTLGSAMNKVHSSVSQVSMHLNRNHKIFLMIVTYA